MRRGAHEYIHRRHKVPLLHYVPEFPVLVPYALRACIFAANILSAEPLLIAAFLHPDSNMRTSKTLQYHAVCASLLSAPDDSKWGHPNSTFQAPKVFTTGPHSVGGVDN